MVIVSSLFYIKENKYDLLLSLKCLLGGCLGSVVGSKLLKCLNQNILKIMFIIFLFYSSLKMLKGE